MVVLPKTELTEYVNPEAVRSLAQATVAEIVSQWVGDTVPGAADLCEN
jgi:hypothetical protein